MGGNKPVVVLIHGIWMTGVDLSLLQHRLRARGFDCRRFAYPSIRHSPVQNAERLHRFLRCLDAEVVHLVAHSLGGIVLLHLFDRYPDQRPGRVVMLGTPAGGSAVARRLCGSVWTRRLVGRSGEQGLLGDAPRWMGRAELGVIAGDRSLGVGRLITRLPGPNDGTVAVAETRLPGAAAHRVLHSSHMGLVFSSAVAAAVCRFLEAGRFDP